MEEIRRRWPLHLLVWNNLHEELKKSLGVNEHGPKVCDTELEALDPRGRTPLMLAVTLGHVECVEALLQAGANVNCDKDGWTVVQEAVSSGDARLVALVLAERDLQRQAVRAGGVPLLLGQLSAAPDFYVEMKWEFTSWVPLVSRMCPFDTYKVYKQGSNVRIDTTLLGFDQNSWQRGNRTYIFRGKDGSAQMIELDHDTRQVWEERLEGAGSPDERRTGRVSQEAVRQRLTAPVCINYLDTEKISFERNKSGMWGWRQDKMEPVNSYECKVFGANNVELVCKTRTEHLSGGDKARAHAPAASRAPLLNLLAIADARDADAVPLVDTDNEPLSSVSNPCNISVEEYFSDEDLAGRDIGRPKEITTKIQKFKATLWLCETYPLQLQEQIMPILDLMASMSSPHFAKLKDFIQMQLPSGFPVKIEIPLYHVLNARITFGNIFGTETAVRGVTSLRESDRLSCVLDDSCFAVPSSYSHVGSEDDRRQFSYEEEEDLLQYAIEQSLMDANGSDSEQVDIWEALKVQRPSRPVTPSFLSEEEKHLQRAIQASLESAPSRSNGSSDGVTSSTVSSDDSDLETALRLSRLERERQERERQQEEYELEQILKLSLLEK